MPETRPPHPSKALAAFGVMAGPRAGEEIPVHSPVATIGQASQNELVLADDSVSKTHARLEYADGGWRLTDLDSTNGTAVEGVRLAPHVPTPLAYGSTVRFGGVQLQFRPGESTDLEEARARHVPPPRPTPVAERRGGFRLPLWLLLVVLLLIGAAVAWFVLDDPAPEPAAVEEEVVSLRVPASPPGTR